LRRFGEFLLQAPRLTLLFLLLLAGFAVYPAMQIQTDFNLEGFYPETDQVIDDYRRLEAEFGRDDNVIMIGFEDQNLLSVTVLNDLKEISELMEQIEFIREVRSLWTVQQVQNRGDNLYFEPWLTSEKLRSEPDNTFLSIKDDPFLDGFLIGTNGTATAIYLEIDEEFNTYRNRNEIIAAINEYLDPYRNRYEFNVSGIPYYRNQYVNLLNGEIVMYIAISSLLIIMLLWYLYRSFWGVFFPMIIVWTTLLLTVALIHLTGGYLEIMSSTIAPILLCVGVADAIHMISKYDDARDHNHGKRSAILEMLATLGSATFLTSITTAIGFATLLSSTVVPMQRFGFYTAVGVLVAYLVTITFLPVALSMSKQKRVFNVKSGGLYLAIKRFLTGVSIFNRKYYKQIVVSTFALTIIMSFGISKLQVNGKIYDDISEDTELMQQSLFFSEKLSAPFPMEFIIDTGTEEGVLSSEFLIKISGFESYLLTYPEIGRTAGIQTLIRETHKTMNPDDAALNPIPLDDALIAQYILLLELNGADELDRFIDFSYQTARLTAFVQDAGSKRINEMRDDISPQFASVFQGNDLILTGTTILSADLVNKIVYSLAWSICLAVVLISLIMAWLFRSFKMVIISMIPNLVPLIMIAGAMGFAGIDIKPSTAVIFTIALGIAVDDSIHYLARFRIEYLRSGKMRRSLRETTIKTGRAIVVTSFILIAGFGTLITSEFTSTAAMGMLVCSTVFSAMIADLLLLPSLFYWMKPELKGGKISMKDS